MKTAVERQDDVQSAEIYKGTPSIVTMKPGKTMTAEAAQKLIGNCRSGFEFTVKDFRIATKEDLEAAAKAKAKADELAKKRAERAKAAEKKAEEKKADDKAKN